MRFHYNGNLTPGSVVSLRSRVEFEIEADGTFEVTDEDLVEFVREHTDYEPVEDDADAEGEDLSELDYRELQSLAADFDDIAGNLAADELRAALEERL